MFFVFFVSLATLITVLRIIFTKRPRNAKNVLEFILVTFIVIYIGVCSLVAGLSHIFMGESIAPQIGWVSGPFEYEVGIANLAIGALGILCIWFREEMLLATVVAGCIWMFGNMIGHVREMVVYHNYAPMNAGIFMWLANIVCLFILAIYIAYRVSDSREKKKAQELEPVAETP